MPIEQMLQRQSDNIIKKMASALEDNSCRGFSIWYGMYNNQIEYMKEKAVKPSARSVSEANQYIMIAKFDKRFIEE